MFQKTDDFKTKYCLVTTFDLLFRAGHAWYARGTSMTGSWAAGYTSTLAFELDAPVLIVLIIFLSGRSRCRCRCCSYCCWRPCASICSKYSSANFLSLYGLTAVIVFFFGSINTTWWWWWWTVWTRRGTWMIILRQKTV